MLTALILISALTSLARSLPNNAPALHPSPGTGMFLMLSDIHFDPYNNPAIMAQLGARPKPGGCPAPTSGLFSKMGSDTNYALLKSTIENVGSTAAQNHIHYDYVILTGDVLAHDFDKHYLQCVGGGPEAGRKFTVDTIRLVDAMIAKALPEVPIFMTLGNNDTDDGDYNPPTGSFLQNVGRDWSLEWGRLPAASRTRALATFVRAGYYAVPNPAVPNTEVVSLNSNLWAAYNAQACSEADPDPGGQFQWLAEVLAGLKSEHRTATVIMHIVPGIDAMKSSMGPPQSLWTDRCTEKFIAEMTDFRGVVREIYAGHIHRDDFRVFPDRDGKPLLPVHILPSVSPVYFNNPAVEIGWYDKHSGDLVNYAPLYLDLANSKTTWTTEYSFARPYGRSRPDLTALVVLTAKIHAGTPQSGIGRQYATYFGVGAGWFLTPENWSNYTCTQTQITLSRFVQCTGQAARK